MTKIVIDIDEEEYNKFVDADKEGYCGRMIDTKVIVNGTPLDDIRSKMMYEIYMDGVDMTNEYHGCWVRFKNIEKIVDKYIGER